MTEKHIATVEVTGECIVAGLNFPRGTRLHRIYQDPRLWAGQTYCLMIEHPDLPVVREGEIPRIIRPQFAYSKQGKCVMEDWGIGDYPRGAR